VVISLPLSSYHVWYWRFSAVTGITEVRPLSATNQTSDCFSSAHDRSWARTAGIDRLTAGYPLSRGFFALRLVAVRLGVNLRSGLLRVTLSGSLAGKVPSSSRSSSASSMRSLASLLRFSAVIPIGVVSDMCTR